MSTAYKWVEPPWPEKELPRDQLEDRVEQLLGSTNMGTLATYVNMDIMAKRGHHGHPGHSTGPLWPHIINMGIMATYGQHGQTGHTWPTWAAGPHMANMGSLTTYGQYGHYGDIW